MARNMYHRTTEDEYQIWVNYGYGWEEVCTEETQKEGLARLAEYRANCPQWPAKMLRKRVKRTQTPEESSV